MPNIKVLDCTLRDGGYVNNWSFGFQNSKKIIHELNNSCIEYIEVGFLEDIKYSQNKTLFSNIEQINELVPSGCKSKITAMIIYGKYDIEKFVPKTKKIKLDTIRVTFKKNEIETVFAYLEKIKSFGYRLFVNPTNIENYNDEELRILIDRINCLNPYCFSIVDTNGVLKENDILKILDTVNNNLDNKIALCFHSHNNLQLSFSNAQLLMKNCKNRELIIDSTVFGMGRGAGNLCTELITQYINDNYGGNYNLIPILKLIDEQINPIFEKTPWGYSVPYYLSAINFAHPNYAKYLIDKQTVPVEIIDKLLKNIPQNKRSGYDEGLIKQIYLDNFSNSIDDSSTLKFLNKIVNNKNILILASGKTLKTEKKKINDFIEKNNPFVVSLNFIPENFDSDLVFITNIKRYMTLPENKKTIIMTSNVSEARNEKKVLNYSKYLNNSKLYDNIALMFLKVLINIGIKKAYFAGLDGFEFINSQNYTNEKLLMTTKIDDYIERNTIMSEQLSKFNKEIEINFVTTTKYKINTEKI